MQPSQKKEVRKEFGGTMHNEKMNPNELCDEALDAVSGGAFDTQKYNIGDRVIKLGRCPGCREPDMFGIVIGYLDIVPDRNATMLRLRMECCGKEIESENITKV